MSTDPANARDALPTDALLDALVQVSFRTMAVLTRVAAEHDLSLTQLRVLAILRDRQVGVTALAQHLGLEKSTMSGLVSRATRRGLVHRSASSVDARSVQISLSPTGRSLAAKIQQQVATDLAPMMAPMSPADRRRLDLLLGRLVGPGS